MALAVVGCLGCASPEPEPTPPVADLADMVRIQAGPFRRGVDDRRGPDEGPAQTIRLHTFYIDRTEVTNARFAEFVAATGYRTSAEADSASRSWRQPHTDGTEAVADHPVVYVSWHDAQAYCRWRNGRLPTEAEWEKAARGTHGKRWPWGDREDASRANGWGPDDPYPGLAPAGMFPQGTSPFGVHDMAGNVWEWCADWYDPDHYTVAAPRDPTGPANGQLRVARGGSWSNPLPVLRTTNRHAVHPLEAGPGLGFRCAATP
jgi:formylglycine-generating enzyme required for sulfatase activity